MEAGKERAGRYAVFSEINVTPFVDVMLVLLVIFMATAPMLRQSLNLSVPETTALPAKISQDPFVLKIKKNQKIYIGESAVSLQTLSGKLKAIFENRRDKAVHLEADKSVPYEIVAQALAEVQAAGLREIYLITVSKQ